MIKHFKYALMAFFLIAGAKLIQSLFIYQSPKKKFYPKIELVEEAKKPLLEEKEQPIEESIQVKSTPDSTEKPIEEQNAENFSVANTYPTLDDLKKNYLSIKNASLQEGRSREDVVIRYYKHEKDENKVYSLRKLRYYIHEKPAVETKGLGSNVIYFGGQVKQEDIQIVAFTLLENGIPLKSIERSKFDWKSNAIEIGTDPELIGTENMTKDRVRDFSL